MSVHSNLSGGPGECREADWLLFSRTFLYSQRRVSKKVPVPCVLLGREKGTGTFFLYIFSHLEYMGFKKEPVPFSRLIH